MSDDEGPDEGDFEDIGEGAVDESEAGEPAVVDAEDAEEQEEGEEVLEVEEAVGSDDDDDDDEEAPTGVDEPDDESEPTSASSKAQPQRVKIDPILKISNKPRVVRVIPPDERVTDNRLQKSEAAYVIAMRAEQIAKFAKSFTETGGLHDPVAIAFKELLERRCPFTLRRAVGTGPAGEALVEEWNVREMTLPPLTPPVALGGSLRPAGRGRGQGRQ